MSFNMLSKSGSISLRWLITGGCGFIGTNLVRLLLADGVKSILIVDNLSVGKKDYLKKVSDFVEINADELNDEFTHNKVRLIVGDVLDSSLADKITRNIDVIVHLAANAGIGPSVCNPRQDFMINAFGTFNYLEGARKNSVKRFILASSGAAVGVCHPPIHEEIKPSPVSPYGASKLTGESYCSAYYNTFNLETIVLRFGNVYGPGSSHKQSIVAKFIKLAMQGEDFEIYGDGKQSRDFIYIDDLVQAIKLAAVNDNVGGEIFQIATSIETTINNLVESLIPILKQYGTQKVSLKYVKKREGDVISNYFDVTKANKVLGWKPSMKLKEGLHLTVKYFIDNSIESLICD